MTNRADKAVWTMTKAPDASPSSAGRATQVRLSTKGLENPALLQINDFALRVKSESFECSRFEAAFLSPRIAVALSQDPTLEEYDLEIDSDEEFDSECLKSVIALSRNGAFEVTDSNFASVKRIAKSLGNLELCETLTQFFTEGKDVKSSNVVERLSLCQFLEVSDSKELD
jgi:hypothetical protein